MRLKSFQIKGYRSIVDTGVIELSKRDNITIFAGQNESGKSSILNALYDFELGKFEDDSLPFSLDGTPVQSVSCTYEITEGDNFGKELSDDLLEQYKPKLNEGEELLDQTKINTIKEFTITRKKNGEKVETSIDPKTITILKVAVSERKVPDPKPAGEVESDAVEVTTTEKLFNITDEDNSKIAEIFWISAPKILLFADFCALLPDKILISDLVNKKEDAEGYRAVTNLEKILGTNFTKKDEEQDAVRRTKEEEQNKVISIDFEKDWGQRIHDENRVLVEYNFEKRETGSYIKFYVQTKEGQRLRPKQRSKGLIWFLSLWLELKAQEANIILLLDEPDQHLHVKAQKDVLGLMDKLAKNGDQICLATHSPYLIEVENLNRVKLVLNTKDHGTEIENITTSKIDAQNKKDALQPIADAIGFHASELSPLGDKNILLEGISDFYYFSAMKEILGRTGDYRFVPGVGLRRINSLISLAIGYGLKWIAIIDDDPALGGKDSANKFDEIKNYVFDGNEDETKKRVYVLSGISGIENMFTFEDLKLVDEQIKSDSNLVTAVGKDRKVLFSTIFLEKVRNKEIKIDQLSDRAQENFDKAFDFIEKQL
jgi:Predicted ATP-dependent endonuclease of the OLD family